MTHNINPLNDNFQPSLANQQDASSGVLSMIQRDRFEMLSAYLDGEVTAAERRQVEEWLANDPTVQQLHSRLLKLRQAFQSVPVPSSERSVEETVEHLFKQVDRRPKLSLVWGGAAIAALFMAAFGSWVLYDRGSIPQMATSPNQIQAPNPSAVNEPVLVALDRPLVMIPKAPVAESVSPARNANSTGDNVR